MKAVIVNGTAGGDEVFSDGSSAIGDAEKDRATIRRIFLTGLQEAIYGPQGEAPLQSVRAIPFAHSKKYDAPVGVRRIERGVARP
jgi:hypothetical protein